MKLQPVFRPYYMNSTADAEILTHFKVNHNVVQNNTTFQSKKTNSTDTQFWPQPTTVLLRTTPTRTINQTKTSVTANNNPSQDYSNPDDQPTTNVSHNQQQSFSVLHQPRQSTNHKRQTQPTTVLLRTTPTLTINQPEASATANNSPSKDFTNPDDQPTKNVSHSQQQSFSGQHKHLPVYVYLCTRASVLFSGNEFDKLLIMTSRRLEMQTQEKTRSGGKKQMRSALV